MSKAYRRGSRRLRGKGSNIVNNEYWIVNKRSRSNKKPMGNIARLLKGIHKRGRGAREVLFKGDFNLIEFVKNSQ